MKPPRFPVLDTWIDGLTPAELVAAIGGRVRAGRGAVVANHNLHSLALHRQGAFPSGWFGEAEIIHADGMMALLVARLAGHPARRAYRTTYLDWLEPLLDEADRNGWRVYHVGGESASVASLLTFFAVRWPGIPFACAPGFFAEGSGEDSTVAVAVAAHRPQLVLAGMGMPRQERWLQRHRHRFPQAVLLPCGAAAKYLIGAEPTPPRWLGRLGLEWLHRFAANPRRMWHRYLIEPFGLVLPVLGFVVRSRLCRRRRPQATVVASSRPTDSATIDLARSSDPGGSPGPSASPTRAPADSRGDGTPGARPGTPTMSQNPRTLPSGESDSAGMPSEKAVIAACSRGEAKQQ